MRSIALVLMLGATPAMTCGGSNDGQDGGAQEATPDRDGSRLRRVKVFAGDGTILTRDTMFDTQTQQRCAWLAHEDGYLYCAPVGTVRPFDKALYVRGVEEP